MYRTACTKPPSECVILGFRTNAAVTPFGSERLSIILSLGPHAHPEPQRLVIPGQSQVTRYRVALLCQGRITTETVC
jgi:hypothetical protein